ncbi:uncharacterized protein LOC114394810 isoform X1 [Glycine soja]|uniref:uncharacterized protein LOC114394810 isoform X1 n=1 Tax=Glycine soja TaxID=3848 RepID=UPI000E21B7AA|nr:uncharacterized protein LOC114394810 isoform X1 [Glycine soja]XP_040868183.1 uncharacterized protein LOC100790370 isoform X3 [Glycine max]|eukprot:XP_025982594.1 uncharacterized protein LOC100790370 isoform X2 [Glycine max]
MARDSCLARVTAGAAMGGAVGGAVGAVYGTYEAIRYKLHINWLQTTIQKFNSACSSCTSTGCIPFRQHPLLLANRVK